MKKAIFAAKNIHMKRYFINMIKALTMFVIMMGFSAPALFGQDTSQEETFSDSGIDTDAYALAYATCKYQIARYYSDFNKDDKQLKKEFQQIQMTHDRFAINIRAKYQADDNMFQKFERKVKTAKKHLPTCIRYQNLLKADDNLQKAKLEKSGTTN